MEQFLDTIRQYDYNIYLFFHGAIHDREWLNSIYLFFAKHGIIFFFLSFIYLILKKKINAFICAFFSMMIAGAIDLFIMLIWKRPRPFISHSSEIITPIIEGLKVDPVSFPSMHTYVAFAMATAIFLYGHKKLGILLYLLSGAIAISRVGAGLHYPTDIIAGTFLGIASGIFAYIVINNAEKRWQE